MARALHKLSARTVETLKTPGRHADGGNLYLSISENGGRRWIFLYRLDGRQREMGLGSTTIIRLARARELAAEARARLAEGRDPIDARNAEKSASQRLPTFGEAADELISDIAGGFRNAKHIDQWRMTLGRARDEEEKLTGVGYCLALADIPINAVTTEHVLEVLKPLWLKKAETASRVRGRIERVLDAAKAKGHRSGENPARWKGHLDHLLPRRQRLQRGHHAAMAYEDVPAFVAELRRVPSLSNLALELLILTASRTGEVLGARWEEIDRHNAVWTVPAERMKLKKAHRVPLTDRMIEILGEAAEYQCGEFIFPGQRRGKPLSNMSLTMVLRRLKRDSVTVHGFRSSFRDWAGDETSFPREVAEAALAHAVGDETERSYRRGDAFKKRQLLMEAWGKFVEAVPSSNVVSILHPTRAEG